MSLQSYLQQTKLIRKHRRFHRNRLVRCDSSPDAVLFPRLAESQSVPVPLMDRIDFSKTRSLLFQFVEPLALGSEYPSDPYWVRAPGDSAQDSSLRRRRRKK